MQDHDSSSQSDDQMKRLKLSLLDVLEHQKLFERNVFDSNAHSQTGLNTRKYTAAVFAKVLGCTIHENHDSLPLVELRLPGCEGIKSFELEQYLTSVKSAAGLLGLGTPFFRLDILIHDSQIAMLHWKICSTINIYNGILKCTILSNTDGSYSCIVESTSDILHTYRSILLEQPQKHSPTSYFNESPPLTNYHFNISDDDQDQRKRPRFNSSQSFSASAYTSPPYTSDTNSTSSFDSMMKTFFGKSQNPQSSPQNIPKEHSRHTRHNDIQSLLPSDSSNYRQQSISNTNTNTNTNSNLFSGRLFSPLKWNFLTSIKGAAFV